MIKIFRRFSFFRQNVSTSNYTSNFKWFLRKFTRQDSCKIVYCQYIRQILTTGYICTISVAVSYGRNEKQLDIWFFQYSQISWWNIFILAVCECNNGRNDEYRLWWYSYNITFISNQKCSIKRLYTNKLTTNYVHYRQ